jgi:hypothetical protein
MSTRNCDQAIDVKVMIQGFRRWGDLEEKMENRNGGGDRGIDGGSAATSEQRQHQKQKVKGGTSGKSHVPNDVCK